MLMALSRGNMMVFTLANKYIVNGNCSSVSIQNPASCDTYNIHISYHGVYVN